MSDDHAQQAILRLRAGKPVMVGRLQLHKNDFPPRHRKRRKPHEIPPPLVEALQVDVIKGKFSPELYEQYRTRAQTYDGSVEVKSKLLKRFRTYRSIAFRSSSRRSRSPSEPRGPFKILRGGLPGLGKKRR